MNIIGIIGQAQHGKDTVADILSKEHGFYRIAFAEALKFDVMKSHKLPIYEVKKRGNGEVYYPQDDRYTDEEIAMRRCTYQCWGTEGRRDIIEDYWHLRWSKLALKAVSEGYTNIVVTDARFEDEVLFLIWMGAIIVGVARPGYRDPGIDYTHRSEASIPCLVEEYSEIKFINDSSLHHFTSMVEEEFRIFFDHS